MVEQKTFSIEKKWILSLLALTFAIVTYRFLIALGCGILMKCSGLLFCFRFGMWHQIAGF